MVVAVGLACGMMSSAFDGKAPESLDVCTLVGSWQRFSGKRVRISAVFHEGAEQSVLSDPACQSGESLIFVSASAHLSGKTRQLRRILKHGREAQVVLEGIFSGPEPIAVDPKLPDWMKEKFEGSTKRYGHLGSLDMMIEVENVIDVKRVHDIGKRRSP